VLKLDYLSCVLTVISTILVGKRWWGGWVLAGINSVVLCVIGYRTSQLGFIPANIFCMVLYGLNVRSWRRAAGAETHPVKETHASIQAVPASSTSLVFLP
jgi:hypothetical protein